MCRYFWFGYCCSLEAGRVKWLSNFQLSVYFSNQFSKTSANSWTAAFSRLNCLELRLKLKLHMLLFVFWHCFFPTIFFFFLYLIDSYKKNKNPQNPYELALKTGIASRNLEFNKISCLMFKCFLNFIFFHAHVLWIQESLYL